ERPGIMWQFAKAVEGIGAACRALDVPITGGNVSLYNETDGRAIYPTPVIGVVGLLEHADRVVSRRVQREGDALLLLGDGSVALFGESARRVLVSVAVDGVSRVRDRAAAAGVPARVVGRTGGSRLRIVVAGQLAIDMSIDEAERAWSSAVERYFQKRVA